MTTLYLRTVSADYTSHGAFQWPREVGAVVEAPDWNPEPVCGGGLHGLPWGQGALGLLGDNGDDVWLVVAADHAVRIDNDKSKFPRCTIVYVGTRDGACAYLLERAPRDVAVPYVHATAGCNGTATAGYGGTATAGDGGTATAGYRGTATAGDGGTATAGDEGTATAGDEGTATAGDEGTLVITYSDKTGRRLLCVGYVGEDGIMPGTAYRVINGKLTNKAEITS